MPVHQDQRGQFVGIPDIHFVICRFEKACLLTNEKSREAPTIILLRHFTVELIPGYVRYHPLTA